MCIWQVFLTTEQFKGRTKNKNSVSKKLTKKNLKYSKKLAIYMLHICVVNVYIWCIQFVYLWYIYSILAAISAVKTSVVTRSAVYVMYLLGVAVEMLLLQEAKIL